jgi:hypothetical protein
MSESENSNEHFARDLLQGAEEICDYLNTLGFKINVDGVYYAHRSKKWPIAKHGKKLLSTKSRLARHAHKIAAAVE